MIGLEGGSGVGMRGEKYGASERRAEREMWEERRYRRAAEVYWWSKLLPEHMVGGGDGGEGQGAVGMSAWSQPGAGGLGGTGDGEMVGKGRRYKAEFAEVCASLLKEERRT